MNSLESKVVIKALGELSEKRGSRITLQSLRSHGGGCINHASLLETTAGRFFLKWNDDCPEDMFLREAEGLAELKKGTPPELIIPAVISTSEMGSRPAFLLMEYLEPAKLQEADELLGRGLAGLHRYEAGKFGFYHDNYCGLTPQLNTWNPAWGDFFAEQRIVYLVTQLRKRGMYTSSENSIFERLIMKIPLLVSDETKPVLIHGDLWAGNYMITSKGPALIDPASYYADREMEMGIMTLFGGFSVRFWAAYNEANPLPAGWKERNKLYQLYHVLNHYLLFGGDYGRQAVELARHYL
jgi:protein-ribulosamine 3-kinase